MWLTWEGNPRSAESAAHILAAKPVIASTRIEKQIWIRPKQVSGVGVPGAVLKTAGSSAVRAVFGPVPVVGVAAGPGEGAPAVPGARPPAAPVLGAVHVLAGAQAVLQVLRPLPCTEASTSACSTPPARARVHRGGASRAEPEARLAVTPALRAVHTLGACALL